MHRFESYTIRHTFKIMIYEIQKFGVTLEWTQSLREAEDAFKDAAFGGVVFYKIVGSKKTAYRVK